MPPDAAADPSFLSALWSWLMTKAPNDDTTLLSVLFAFNAGFSTVDSIIGGMLKRLRTKIRCRICRYTDAEWIKSVAPDDTEQDKTKRDVMTALVKGVTDLQDEIPSMFCKNACVWKVFMAIAAAIALYCMAVPHTQRITLLLALPIPLFLLSCRIELNSFNKRLDAACKNLEKERDLIKDATASEKKKENIETKITDSAQRIKSFECARPMPPPPPPSKTPQSHRGIRTSDGNLIYI